MTFATLNTINSILTGQYKVSKEYMEITRKVHRDAQDYYDDMQKEETLTNLIKAEKIYKEAYEHFKDIQNAINEFNEHDWK